MQIVSSGSAGNRGTLYSYVGGRFCGVFGRGWFVVCSLFRRVALLDGTGRFRLSFV